MNHNRSTALERSVKNYWGALTGKDHLISHLFSNHSHSNIMQCLCQSHFVNTGSACSLTFHCHLYRYDKSIILEYGYSYGNTIYWDNSRIYCKRINSTWLATVNKVNFIYFNKFKK